MFGYVSSFKTPIFWCLDPHVAAVTPVTPGSHRASLYGSTDRWKGEGIIPQGETE